MPENEAAWLDLRQKDITSTMSPGLFGFGYHTAFELYHSKASGLELPFKDNERIGKGRRLQDYAADEVALKHGWKVWRADEYIRLSDVRMGTSLDYRVECPKRGRGILEIKGVDWLIHRYQWIDDQAPEHIEIQMQHQLEVCGEVEWGMVAAFTSIYDWHEYERPRDRDFGAALVQKVREFWASVDAGTPPAPDFSSDSEVIKALHRDNGGVLDRMDDLEFNALLSKLARLQDEKKQAEDDYKATQAELIHRLGNHGEAYGRDYKFKVTMTKDSAGTEVTPEMVGSYVGARKGYPRCTLSDLHKKKGEAA